MRQADTHEHIFNIVNDFFKGDMRKTLLWFTIKNPLIGNIEPFVMLQLGKEEKLLRIIQEQTDGNKPPKPKEPSDETQ